MDEKITRPIFEMSRRMGPLEPNHPLVVGVFDNEAGMNMGEGCRACNQPFKAGDYVTLVALGPGDDPDARQRAREGRPYNAVALPVHWACATGRED